MRRPCVGPRVGAPGLLCLAAAFWAAGCGGSDGDSGSSGGVPDPVVITVPAGAAFSEVVDTLSSRGLVSRPTLFRLYARSRGDDRRVRAGEYALEPGRSWAALLDDLVTGRVRTVAITIPEGFVLGQIAPRLARVTGLEPDSVLAFLTADSVEERFRVPGPGLEGYLYPDTYRFAQGVPLQRVVEELVTHYRDQWTPRRRARADSLGLTEREVATLASIIEGEALLAEEMPIISSVYHNRLERGWLLQADPTVQYALGERKTRLLYRDIDAVADHPYNTYTQPGLPPGPIGAPSGAALEAALFPAETDYLFFVARPDGSHVFTRTLAEHNRAKAQSRRELDRLEGENARTEG